MSGSPRELRTRVQGCQKCAQIQGGQNFFLRAISKAAQDGPRRPLGRVGRLGKAPRISRLSSKAAKMATHTYPSLKLYKSAHPPSQQSIHLCAIRLSTQLGTFCRASQGFSTAPMN